MDSNVNETDVLIVGASIPGYVSAATLTSMRLKCQIIDKASTSKKLGSVNCLQPRSLEILQALRLKALLEEQGTRVRETASWSNSNGRLSQESIEPWTDPTALFPYDLALDGTYAEACLENFLSCRGVVVKRSMELAQLQYQSEKDPPLVTAYIKNHVSGCVEIWRARFIVGSDGVNSDVRKLSRIPLLGPESKMHWIIATVNAVTDFPDHRRRAFIWCQEQCLVVTPGKSKLGRYHLRLLLSTQDVLELEESSQNATSASIPTSIAVSKAISGMLDRSIKRIFAPYQFKINQILFIEHNSTFKQIAAQFCDETYCTFLLGDSSHTHSLWADHQVNIGIADAWSLTWKLALVCKGKASRSTLSTHSMEQQSLALNLGRSLEMNYTPEEGDHFDFQEKKTLVAAHGRQYAPNSIIKEEVRNNIKGNRLAPGKILTPPFVTRHSNGDEVSLIDEFPVSAKFHLLIFAGNILSQPILLSLCSYLSKTSVLWSLDQNGVASGDTSAESEYVGVAAEAYLIHTSSHLEISLANLPMPFTMCDRVYEDVSGKAHDFLGISQNLGALVLLRPDLVISIVTNLDDAPGIARFMNALSDG